MHFKSLMRNINVINAALLAILVLFAAYKVPSFFHIQAKYSLPPPSKSAEKEEKTVETPPLSPSEYTVIAEQNIFHPERKIPDVQAQAAPPLPKPEFVLYGTMVSSDLSLAYMEDRKSAVNSPGKGRRQKALKQGETISGFTLKKIEPDKVVMIRGEEKLEVRVTDKARSQGNGIVTTTQGPAVSSAISGPRPQPAVPSASAQTPADEARKRREAIRNLRGQRQPFQQNTPQ